MFLFLLLIPLQLFAAEVLQIRTSMVLQIGDQNRSYSVRLACLDVDPSDERKAREFLKSKLPRGKKINFKPKGVVDGSLLAIVTPIGMEKDVSRQLIDANLGNSLCD